MILPLFKTATQFQCVKYITKIFKTFVGNVEGTSTALHNPVPHTILLVGICIMHAEEAPCFLDDTTTAHLFVTCVLSSLFLQGPFSIWVLLSYSFSPSLSRSSSTDGGKYEWHVSSIPGWSRSIGFLYNYVTVFNTRSTWLLDLPHHMQVLPKVDTVLRSRYYLLYCGRLATNLTQLTCSLIQM